MKKSLLIISGNLLAHMLIAFATAYKLYSSSLHSSQGQIFWISREMYLAIFGFIFILASFIIMFILRKQYLAPMLLSILLSCGVWVLSGNIMSKRLVAQDAQELRASQDNWNDMTKTETLEYAGKMNLQMFKWDSVRAICFAKDRDGLEHTFYANQNSVWVICRIDRPAINDTLSWLKLTVKEASFYLSPDALKTYKLGIDSGHYSFYADLEKTVMVEIAPINNGKTFLSLRGTACKQSDGFCMRSYGNFALQLSDEIDRIP